MRQTPETEFQFYIRILRVFFSELKIEIKESRDYLLTVKILKFVWEKLYLREILKFSAYCLFVGFLFCISLCLIAIWQSLKLTWHFLTWKPFIVFYKRLWRRIRFLLKLIKILFGFTLDILGWYGQLSLKISKTIDDWFDPYLQILRKYRTAAYRAFYYQTQRYYIFRDYWIDLFKQTLVYDILDTSFVLISKIIRLVLIIAWFFSKIMLENIRDFLVIGFKVSCVIFNMFQLIKSNLNYSIKYLTNKVLLVYRSIIAFLERSVLNYPHFKKNYKLKYPIRGFILEFFFYKPLFFVLIAKNIPKKILRPYKTNFKNSSYYTTRESNYWKIRHKLSALWFRHRRKCYIVLIFIIPHYLSKLEVHNVWYCLFLNSFLIFFAYFYILPTEDFRYLFAPLREASIKWSLNRFLWKDDSYWQTLVSTRLYLRLILKIWKKTNAVMIEETINYELKLFPDIQEEWEFWCTWAGFRHLYRLFSRPFILIFKLELQQANLHYIVLRHIRYAKYRKYLYKKVRNTCDVERYGDKKYLIPYYIDRENNCYGGYINIKEYKWARENTKTEYMGKSRDDCLWTGL